VLRIEMRDGSTIDLGPDDAFEIPPGHDAWVIGDEPWVSIDTVGRRNFGTAARPVGRRYLATILFVDIVGSTEKVRELGDPVWRDLLADHNVQARGSLERHHGLEIGTIGDGLLATFDSPAHGVLAAEDIAKGANELGLHVRAGLHTGEVERAGDDIRGITVHHAARVAGEAGHDEILVSSATRVLLGGAGIPTVSVGVRPLKGIEDPDELFRVEPRS
jgi:class 3 adenylate cyclase